MSGETKETKGKKRQKTLDIKVATNSRIELNRSVYSLFHKLVKIAEKAENAGDENNKIWALNQLQSMITGRLKSGLQEHMAKRPKVEIPMSDDIEEFVKKPTIPPGATPKKNELSINLAEMQGRRAPTV